MTRRRTASRPGRDVITAPGQARVCRIIWRSSSWSRDIAKRNGDVWGTVVSGPSAVGLYRRRECCAQLAQNRALVVCGRTRAAYDFYFAPQLSPVLPGSALCHRGGRIRDISLETDCKHQGGWVVDHMSPRQPGRPRVGFRHTTQADQDPARGVCDEPVASSRRSTWGRLRSIRGRLILPVRDIGMDARTASGRCRSG